MTAVFKNNRINLINALDYLPHYYATEEMFTCLLTVAAIALNCLSGDATAGGYITSVWKRGHFKFHSKFVDHLPLYRQRQQFKRQGVDLSASTLDNWVTSGYDLLLPLYELQRERIIRKEYLMADETPIQVLDKIKKGKTHRGYFWVYHDPLEKEILFDYQDNRSRAGPFQILKDFKGFLQTDGYNVYDEIGQWEMITLLGCMAHARRYFDKSLPNDKKRSEWMLIQVQRLYKTEAFVRDNHYSHEERYNLRQREAVPILDEMKAWLDTEALQVLPKSTMGKAIGYMLGRWKYLKRYIARLRTD